MAKALSYAYAYPHLPVVREYVNYILRVEYEPGVRVADYFSHLTTYERERYQDVVTAYFGSKIPDFDPHPATRALVESRYKISVEQQLAAEAHLRSLTKLGPVRLDLDYPQVAVDCWNTYVGGHPTTVANPDQLLEVGRRMGAPAHWLAEWGATATKVSSHKVVVDELPLVNVNQDAQGRRP